jgi:hypothetical protein
VNGSALESALGQPVDTTLEEPCFSLRSGQLQKRVHWKWIGMLVSSNYTVTSPKIRQFITTV